MVLSTRPVLHVSTRKAIDLTRDFLQQLNTATGTPPFFAFSLPFFFQQNSPFITLIHSPDTLCVIHLWMQGTLESRELTVKLLNYTVTILSSVRINECYFNIVWFTWASPSDPEPEESCPCVTPLSVVMINL